MLSFFRRNITPRLGVALAVWRVEARTATPLALLLVATIGRWEGAVIMGAIMACYSALFLFLLDGERVMDEVRDWMKGRSWARRYITPVAESKGRSGTLQRALALPWTVMFMGPFFRAITYHLFHMRRVPAYTLSVGGSIPHSLLWTGLVLGGLWEGVIRPLLGRLF